MSGKQPGEGRTVSFDDPIFICAIIALMFGAGYAVWYFGHTYLSTAYAYVRYVEFYPFHLLGELVELPGISHIHRWLGGLCAPDGAISLCRRDFSTVAWYEIADSSLYVNAAILLGLVAYCVRLFLRANATHPKLRFSRAHTIKSFVNEQKTAVNPKTGKLLYPHLRMFSAIDLISAPLDDPTFGMSQTSKQFAYKNRLVIGWKQEGSGFWAPTLDRKKAAEVFRIQLGKHWTSSANLSPGETLLVAIAIPRVAATDTSLDDAAFDAAMASSDSVIRYCWDQFVPPNGKAKAEGDPNAWLRPTIDLTMPREVIKRYIGTGAVQSILEHHAFNRTVIVALYMQARRLGVLQPAEMRWLRFFDRPLWYVLETIGRQAGFAEAAGVLSHYLYEAKSGGSLVEAQLDKAVSGLEAALNNFKFTDADKARYGPVDPPPVAPVDKK